MWNSVCNHRGALQTPGHRYGSHWLSVDQSSVQLWYRTCIKCCSMLSNFATCCWFNFTSHLKQLLRKMVAIHPEVVDCPYARTGDDALWFLHLLELSHRGRFWSTKVLLLDKISCSISNSSYMNRERNKGYYLCMILPCVRN